MPRNPQSESLGRYLRELRSRVGLTLRQVEATSRSHGETVTFDYLSRAEAGHVTPSPVKLLTLARVYEVPAQSFMDAIELAELEPLSPPSADPEECRRVGVQAAEQGDYRTAYACFVRALRLIETDEDLDPRKAAEESARTRVDLSISLLRLGKYHMACQEIERVLEARERSELVTCHALNTLSHIHYQLDRIELAEVTAHLALRSARRLKDTDQISEALINLANPRYDRRKYRSAAGGYNRALELLGSETASSSVFAAWLNMGNCHYKLSNWDAAEDAYLRALETAERLRNPRLRARGLLERGRLMLARQRHTEARPLLSEARAIAAAHDYRSELFHSTYYLWSMALQMRVGGEAGELFRILRGLRPRLDQRSDEILAFDDYAAELHARTRKKGGKS